MKIEVYQHKPHRMGRVGVGEKPEVYCVKTGDLKNVDPILGRLEPNRQDSETITIKTKNLCGDPLMK